MRGPDEQTADMFSYLSPEARVRADHPLRAIRLMTDQVLRELSPRFQRYTPTWGGPPFRPSSCCGPCCCKGSTRFAVSGC